MKSSWGLDLQRKANPCGRTIAVGLIFCPWVGLCQAEMLTATILGPALLSLVGVATRPARLLCQYAATVRWVRSGERGGYRPRVGGHSELMFDFTLNNKCAGVTETKLFRGL